MGKQWKQCQTLFLGGSKITADGDCSHEIKRCLLLERKVMTNLDSIFKSRDITLPAKVHLVKAMVFSVLMYGCESWTVKKAWALKNWCSWTVVFRKSLENPFDCKEIQSVSPKEISLEFSLEGQMLKLKLQSCGHLMQRPWCWERLRVGGKGDNRGWDGWMASLTQWTWICPNSGRQ